MLYTTRILSTIRCPTKMIRSVHRVALVGSGPSSFYSAKYLLDQHPDLLVDMYEKLPVPFGLVRFGVAPDHPEVKSVQTQFAEIAQSPRFRYFGNVSVGGQAGIPLSTLKNAYSGVILAFGATSDNDLNVPNEHLTGIHSARHFVNWYNGHPDFTKSGSQLFNLQDVRDVVIVGQGNVAIDCARVLTRSLDELAVSDITSEALNILSKSNIRRVTLIGRRGHVQAAFTIKEFRELTRLKGVHVDIDKRDIEAGLTDASKTEIKDNRPKKRITELIESTANTDKVNVLETDKVVDFKFLLSPARFNGTTDSNGQTRVSSLIATRNKLVGEPNNQKAVSIGEEIEIPCQLVLKSVGYKCEPICSDLPFDSKHNVVPSSQGRVITSSSAVDSVVRGLYVAGWLKRGPTGIIGTNIPDAKETVASLLADIKNQSLQEHDEDPLNVLVNGGLNMSQVVQWSDYTKIDALETKRGQESNPPKEREKILDCSEMLSVARS